MNWAAYPHSGIVWIVSNGSLKVPDAIIISCQTDISLKGSKFKSYLNRVFIDGEDDAFGLFPVPHEANAKASNKCVVVSRNLLDISLDVVSGDILASKMVLQAGESGWFGGVKPIKVHIVIPESVQ